MRVLDERINYGLGVFAGHTVNVTQNPRIFAETVNKQGFLYSVTLWFLNDRHLLRPIIRESPDEDIISVQ